MSFSRIRPPGLWLLETVVDPDEFEAFDESLSNALDGKDGGACAPSSQIQIGGAGLLVAGDGLEVEGDGLIVNADSAFLGGVALAGPSTVVGSTGAEEFTVLCPTEFFHDVTIGNTSGDNLIVNAAAAFLAGVALAGPSTVVGSVGSETFTVLCPTTLLHDVTMDGGDVTIEDGALTIGNETIVIGDSSCAFGNVDVSLDAASTLVINCPTTIADPVTLSGDGRIRERITFGGNADASYGPATADHVRVQGSVLSADRDYTIDDTGAVDGDTITFTSVEGTHRVSVRRPGGVLISSILFAAAECNWAKCIRISGTWQLHSRGLFG